MAQPKNRLTRAIVAVFLFCTITFFGVHLLFAALR